ncbi:MAG: type II toxin-antitoxin system VapC family toxin [Acidimicrobiales bacterium]
MSPPAGQVVLDTGILLAGADADDGWHDRATSLLEERPAGQLLLPTTVATEAAWMIGARLGPATEAAFVASVGAGEFEVVDLVPADWVRSAELIDTYADLGLGLVDASVVAVAERLGIARVAIVDRRDFTVIRPRHIAAFELLP